MRTPEVWMHTVDLNNGATFTDILSLVLERLLKDITGARKPAARIPASWSRWTAPVQGALTFGDINAANPTVITGPLPAIVQWAAGRGDGGVTATGPGTDGTVPAPPKWITSKRCGIVSPTESPSLGLSAVSPTPNSGAPGKGANRIGQAVERPPRQQRAPMERGRHIDDAGPLRN